MTELYGWIAAAIAFVVGLFWAHKSGKDKARKKIAEKIKEDSDAIHKVDSEVAQMADDDVRVELRRWLRNNDD